MVEEINRLRKANESLGGSFEVRAFGLVPGLGSHVSWETASTAASPAPSPRSSR
jgi:chorismate synthase